MKEEKLQSLYYYFIKKRHRMLTDGLIVAESSSAVDGGFLSAENLSAVDGIGVGREAFAGPQMAFQGNFLPDDQNWPLEPNYGGYQQPIFHVPEGEVFESNEITAIGSNLLKIANDFSSSHPKKSEIQFEKHCIVVAPQEQIIFIPVLRNDKDLDKERKFTWETCAKSALADIHFVASSGEATFELGETKKNIPIKILTSNDEASNLHFIVKLTNVCGVFNPDPLTITLKKVNDFYTDEISVLNNLAELQPSSPTVVKSILFDCLNQRTFYMGLSFLCSTTDTLNVQLALALELGRICRPKLRDDVILGALYNFFSQDDIQP